jgi:hypothetical protein
VAALSIGRPDKTRIFPYQALFSLKPPPRPFSPASWPLFYNQGMANLTLVYGLRLLPSDEVAEVGDAVIQLKNGREARVTMHILEGGKEEIEKQLKNSLSAFFDFYPEI